MRAQRRKAEIWGRRAERLAKIALALKGYRILEHRCRLASGEIDLVVRRGKVIAAVEVKARTVHDDEAISATQWQRIARTLELYLSRKPELAGLERRFDRIDVAPRRWPRHSKDVWRP
jgi:putative endonuclease